MDWWKRFNLDSAAKRLFAQHAPPVCCISGIILLLLGLVNNQTPRIVAPVHCRRDGGEQEVLFKAWAAGGFLLKSRYIDNGVIGVDS